VPQQSNAGYASRPRLPSTRDSLLRQRRPSRSAARHRYEDAHTVEFGAVRGSPETFHSLRQEPFPPIPTSVLDQPTYLNRSHVSRREGGLRKRYPDIDHG
jgi:hypothetical protein